MYFILFINRLQITAVTHHPLFQGFLITLIILHEEITVVQIFGRFLTCRNRRHQHDKEVAAVRCYILLTSLIGVTLQSTDLYKYPALILIYNDVLLQQKRKNYLILIYKNATLKTEN